MNQKNQRCPTCNVNYTGEQKFCNQCGSALVEIENCKLPGKQENSNSQDTKKNFQTIDNSGSILSPTISGNGNIHITIGTKTNKDRDN